MTAQPPLALVTGGLHRVGAVIAARLARAGYALAIHKRSPGEADAVLTEALAETGAECHRFACDLGDSAAVDALLPAVIAKYGRAPDLLVNNAAHFADGDWTTLTNAALSEMMQVNHHAPVMLAKALVAASGPDAQPTIINILDQRIANPVPDQLAYSLSKSALWQATRTLAVAFGGKARVNAVAPGLTIVTDDYQPGQADRIAAHMPLGALPNPDQIADAVLYLARAEATTGQTIFVDGGAHLSPQGRDFVFLGRG